MKKLALLLVPCALLAACNSTTADLTNDGAMMEADSSDAMMEDDGSAIDAADDSDSMMEDETSSDEAMAPAGDARVIEMTATDWAFSPNVVSVKKGEKVVIRLKGIDGSHSLMIEELGINQTIDPGQTVDIEIPTDKAGTFTFRCRVPCGEGHKDMTGTLTIEG